MIASELIQNGVYECYIKIEVAGQLYWKQISVPEELATEENKQAWIAETASEAEQYYQLPEVE